MDDLIKVLERIAAALERANEIHCFFVTSQEDVVRNDEAHRERMIAAIEEASGKDH